MINPPQPVSVDRLTILGPETESPARAIATLPCSDWPAHSSSSLSTIPLTRIYHNGRSRQTDKKLAYNPS